MNKFLDVMDMLAWFPDNASTYGAELDALFGYLYYLSVGIFFITFGLLGWFLWKYRYSPSRRGYNYHGNNTLELAWTILPTLLFVGIGLYSDDVWERTKYSAKVPRADVEILLLGRTYGWMFLYAGADGEFGRNAFNDRTARALMSSTNPFGIDSTDPYSADDFMTTNQFRVPVNANVVFRGSSLDVLHSVFLPNMRVKQDILPGTWMNIWFNSFKTGKYELACAELCGGGHYAMRGTYEVMSKQDYDVWLFDQHLRQLASND